MIWKKYQRKGLSEMRPYIPGENLANVSISHTDTPEEGGMIARNPKDHNDQWYVTKKYFDENLEEIKEETPEEMAAKILADNTPEDIKLPSAIQIGQAAFINLWEEDIIGECCAVHFYPGKVKYDFGVLASSGVKTIIYNIDSVFVSGRKQSS